ncbi:MAG: L,D-transpeptidase family protein [Candidatus Geothermincolia bacterium]
MRTNSITYRSVVWIGEQKSYRVTLFVGVAFLVVLMLALCPFLIASDASAFGRFPSGSMIAGVNVGGLTEAEALELCEKKLAPVQAQPVSLKIDTESWSVTPAELGLVIDYKKMVADAYSRAWNVNVIERLVRRFLGRPKKVNMPIQVAYDKGKVSNFVTCALPQINCKPRNAYLDVSMGTAVMVQGKDGREADPSQVVAATEKGLNGGARVIEVPLVKRTPPAEPAIQPQKVIVVNLGEHTLRLYNGEQLLAEYSVATGSDQWPTCTGQWKIVRMEKNPTWYNRGSTWADNMPPSIGPGPNNPLGTRAMTINGGGVLIHGTSDTGSLGTSASHGCVRMAIPEVEALYDQCNIGMPVYIIKQTGKPGFDYTKHPFWWGHE